MLILYTTGEKKIQHEAHFHIVIEKSDRFMYYE
jgi:hypothetical protein